MAVVRASAFKAQFKHSGVKREMPNIMVLRIENNGVIEPKVLSALPGKMFRRRQLSPPTPP